MRKAILVPSDITHNVKPVDETLNKLDSEMMSIIQQEDIPIDIKARRYNQILQRYKFLQTERDKPYRIEIDEPIPAMNFESILKGIPETKIPLAKLLTDFILKQKNIQVEDDGEITINGNRIHNSNIIDLVHDLVRERKTFPAPVGLETLAKALKQVNIPFVYIGNKYRHHFFQTPKRNTTAAPKTLFGWSE